MDKQKNQTNTEVNSQKRMRPEQTETETTKRSRNSEVTENHENCIKNVKDLVSICDLKCPVCTEIPRNKTIYQCKNGHFVCNMCHPKLDVKKCPECRDDLFETRNKFRGHSQFTLK